VLAFVTMLAVWSIVTGILMVVAAFSSPNWTAAAGWPSAASSPCSSASRSSSHRSSGPSCWLVVGVYAIAFGAALLVLASN
jgi:uncharacterized membrane protein HdeD (DUF308 family)